MSIAELILVRFLIFLRIILGGIVGMRGGQ
jgi:hypothetical protein